MLCQSPVKAPGYCQGLITLSHNAGDLGEGAAIEDLSSKTNRQNLGRIYEVMRGISAMLQDGSGKKW